MQFPLRRAARARALAFVATALLARSSTTAAGADLYGTITGRVVSADSGAAIRGAAVSVFTEQNDAFAFAAPAATSRPDGSFAVIGIGDPDVVITVEVQGYQAQECRYRLSPGGQTRLTFQLLDVPHRMESSKPRAAARCPAAPIGGGQTQDVYVIR